jgi:dihydroorotate dehydrogenase electron transfer subunit
MTEMPSLVSGRVLDNPCVAPGHHLLKIGLPPGFATPAPGQFVMLRETGRQEPLLSRPLSVLGFNRCNGGAVLDLLYRVAGRGTALLSRLCEGDTLTLLGPLGRGFSLFPDRRRVLFVAGGVGVAPLIYLLQAGFPLPEGDMPSRRFYLGARSADLLAGLERLEGSCELDLCTDDGSRGYQGSVTDLLRRDLAACRAEETIIYACGPAPMLRSLSRLLEGHPIPCQVSLEERMACGLGACLGCTVAVFASSGEKSYRRVCHDGPVFALGEIYPPFRRGGAEEEAP